MIPRNLLFLLLFPLSWFDFCTSCPIKTIIDSFLNLEGSNPTHPPIALSAWCSTMHTEEKTLLCPPADFQLKLCLILFQPLLKLVTKPKLECCVNLLRKEVLEPSRKHLGLSTFATTDQSRLLEAPSFLGFHDGLLPWLFYFFWPDLSSQCTLLTVIPLPHPYMQGLLGFCLWSFSRPLSFHLHTLFELY